MEITPKAMELTPHAWEIEVISTRIFNLKDTTVEFAVVYRIIYPFRILQLFYTLITCLLFHPGSSGYLRLLTHNSSSYLPDIGRMRPYQSVRDLKG